MNPARRPSPDPTRPAEDARQRLLRAGLHLFAHQGFAKTSTRELAEAAQVNVAAISYYFGDKAGLYRAVLFEPEGDIASDVARFTAEGLPLADALHHFYESFLATLREGELARLCTKLHFREMLEPSGLYEAGVAQGIVPMHLGLLAVLQRELGLVAPDRELERVAICLAGLGVHLHVGLDVNEQLAPGINTGPGAFDAWTATLTRAGIAIVEAERSRRRTEPAVEPQGTPK